VLFDLALDYATTPRLGLARADQCGAGAFRTVCATLGLAGFECSPLDDVAGLVVLRLNAMLVNEARTRWRTASAARTRSTSRCAYGVNYPRGPMEWSEQVGLRVLRARLANLRDHYGEERYRTSALITRKGYNRRGLPRMSDGMAEHQHATRSDMDPHAIAEAVRHGMFENDAASKAMGMQVEEVGPGFARVSMIVRPEMLNGFGSATRAHHDARRLGVRLRLQQLQRDDGGLRHRRRLPRSGHEGDRLVAECHEVSRSGRTGVYDIKVTNQHGKTVVVMRGRSHTIKGRQVINL